MALTSKSQRVCSYGLFAINRCAPVRFPPLNTIILSRRLSSKGESTFADYLSVRERFQQVIQNEEREKSQRMFEAWSKTQESSSPTSQGVAVVKTLAKETKRIAAEDGERQKLKALSTSLLKQAALDHGHAEALVLWGNHLLETISEEDRSRKESLDIIHRAMKSYQESDSSRGWFNLGLLKWNGYPDQSEEKVSPNDILLPSNVEQAMDSFTKARELGDHDALFFCGVQNLASGEEAKIQKGFLWIKDSAERGHGGALHYLALLYLSGHEGLSLPPDEDLFRAYLIRSVKAGNADALFLRGHAKLKGEHGFSVDLQAALHDFEEAGTSLNHSDASVSAGAMYFSGIGVEQDEEKAFELYQHAGELGNAEGWRNVVSCYLTGRGVPQNEKAARYIQATVLDRLAG